MAVHPRRAAALAGQRAGHGRRAVHEGRLAAKRKHDANLEAQRVYNKTIKSGARKKMKEALASAATQVEPAVEDAASSAVVPSVE